MPTVMSEETRRFRDGMVGTWEMDRDTYFVFVPPKEGGLAAVSLTTGKEVGAGLPMGGRRIGPLPENFKMPDTQ
jgi:hypothetical protein